MDMLIQINSLFLPEFTILCFMVINFILSFFTKKNEYKTAKIVTIVSVCATVISLIYCSLSEQNSIFASNIFTAAFKALILLSSVLVLSASHNLIRENRKHSFKFFNLFLAGILGGFILVSSREIILCLIGMLILNYSCYKLLSFGKRHKEACNKYLINSVLSCLLMVTGIIILCLFTGNTVYEAISVNINKQPAVLGGMFILFAVMINMGIIPFVNNYKDIFENMSSGLCMYLSLIPVIAQTAFLSGIFVFLFAYSPVLRLIAVLVAVMTLVNSVIKINFITNIKKIYAYSAIINISFFIILISTVDVYALSGVIIGLLIYIFSVTGMWSASIISRMRYQSDEIEDYKGLFYTRPYFSIAYLICILSMMGFPPAAGFISRLYGFISLSRIDMLYLLVLVISVISFVIFMLIFLKIISNLFEKRNNNVCVNKMFIIPKITLYLCALANILIFLMPDKIIRLSQIIAYYI